MAKNKRLVGIVGDNPELFKETAKRLVAGDNFHEFRTISDLAERSNEKYSGFIIDFNWFFKNFQTNKIFLTDLENGFPVIKLKSNGPNQPIEAMVRDKVISDPHEISRMFSESLERMAPRGIRVNYRKDIYLNVRIFGLNGNAGSETHGNTANLSATGAFIMHPVLVEVGQKIQVNFKELKFDHLLDCSVIWQLPWGVSTAQPSGFGIKFEVLSEKMKSEIYRLSGTQ